MKNKGVRGPPAVQGSEKRHQKKNCSKKKGWGAEAVRAMGWSRRKKKPRQTPGIHKRREKNSSSGHGGSRGDEKQCSGREARAKNVCLTSHFCQNPMTG